ncbi:MAG: T9SS type A sorting domain-containing protein [Aureispira sp.]|nr:T9SS type A sorting domain-containing protein [Aureispira sp.]
MKSQIFTILLIVLFNQLQAQTRVIFNTSFESPSINGANYRQLDESLIEGWETTSPDAKIELWTSGFHNVPAQEGTQFAEINATQAATLYQELCLQQGETIQWSLWHRGRSGVDHMSLTIGGQVQDTFATGRSAWANYTGSYTHTGGSGMVLFEFRAVSTAAGQNSSVGNFLDNIVITGLLPTVEFLIDTASSPEAVGDNIPMLIINGEVLTNQTVEVDVIGGTADAKDYSYTTKSIMIPAGMYDGTINTGIVIPLTIVDDDDVEANETIQFGLSNASTGIMIGDANCDGINIDQHNYTILNDDVDLPVELLYFTAQSENENVLLAWATATEINNEKFEIEHMAPETEEFVVVNTIAGAGTTQERQEYNHKLYNLAAGMHYFRIKQIDFDGAYTYSEAVAINMEHNMPMTVNVFPNPVGEVLNVRINGLDKDIDNMQVRIVNMQGQVVHQELLAVNNTTKQEIYAVQNLPEGAYTVLLNFGNARQVIKKFIKK